MNGQKKREKQWLSQDKTQRTTNIVRRSTVKKVKRSQTECADAAIYTLYQNDL